MITIDLDLLPHVKFIPESELQYCGYPNGDDMIELCCVQEGTLYTVIVKTNKGWAKRWLEHMERIKKTTVMTPWKEIIHSEPAKKNKTKKRVSTTTTTTTTTPEHSTLDSFLPLS